MKTVYLDNNCYARLLRDRGAFSLLLSLSHNRRGVLSFESSVVTVMEFAQIWRRPRCSRPFLDLVRLARKLVRRDRVFQDVSDIVRQEVLQSTGQRAHVNTWHKTGCGDYEQWQRLLEAVCRGGVPRRLLDDIDSMRKDHVRFSEQMTQEMLARMRPYERRLSGETLSLEALIFQGVDEQRQTNLVTAAQEQYPDLPRSESRARTLVLQHLHALRASVGVSCAFALVRIAGQLSFVDPRRSMKRQGTHKGGDYFDLRHATYGRYVDYFVTEERLLRTIVNNLGETNYAGLPYRAHSLPEFLAEAERMATG